MRAFECIFSYVQQEMSANFDVLQASFDEYFSAGELIVSEQWTIDPSFFSTLIKWQMFSKISLTWKKTKQSDWRLMHRRGLQTFLSEGCISYYTKDRGPCIFRNEVVSGWVTSSNTFFAIYIIFHFWQMSSRPDLAQAPLFQQLTVSSSTEKLVKIPVWILWLQTGSVCLKDFSFSQAFIIFISLAGMEVLHWWSWRKIWIIFKHG